MRRRITSHTTGVAVALLGLGLPGLLHAQTPSPTPPPEAEQRLAALAERFAEGSATPKPDAAKTDGSHTAAQASTPTASNNPSAPQTDSATTAAQADTPATADTPVEQRPLGGVLGRGGDAEGFAQPTGGWTLSTLAALGVVIALIFAARWGYARLGGRVIARSSPAVEVLSRTTVAPKNQVVLLRIGQRVLVVGDSPSGLRTLANLDEPEEVAALLQTITAAQHDSVTRTFGSLVSRFNGEHDQRAMQREEGGDGSEYRIDRTRDSLSGLASRLRTMSGSAGNRGESA